MAKKHTNQSKQSSKAPAKKPATVGGGSRVKYLIIGALAVAVGFGAYQFISARSTAGSGAAIAGATDSAPVTGPQVDGTAQVTGGVQKIAIAVTNVYSPNVIHLKAGVPAELTFSGGQGCASRFQSQALGFSGDLSSGPAVIKLKALEPGTYPFACTMDMVHGKIVVQ